MGGYDTSFRDRYKEIYDKSLLERLKWSLS